MRAVHASRPGLPGDHRTDGIACRCDPWQLVDMNEPARAVVVHRAFDEDIAREPGAPFHPVRIERIPR
jgi:hypothetical protein